MPRKKSLLSRKVFKYSFLRFICIVVLFWLIFMLYMSRWNSKFSNVIDEKFVNVDIHGMIKKSIVEKVAVEQDFEDEDVVVDEKYDKFLNETSVESPKNLIGLHRIPKPVQSSEVMNILSRLNLSNPGHMGESIKLPSPLPVDIEIMINKSWEKYQINEFLSNLVPLDRQLPDQRTNYCKRLNYTRKLPTATAILVFHNEALSMILRTVYSLLINSSPELLKEIILVDDCSTHDNLKSVLEESISKLPKTRILRSPIRIGLMKARMLGAVNAKGPALIFMDSHMEVSIGWLEPLLDRLAENKNITAISSVETLSFENMGLNFHRDPKNIPVNGFDWNLIFNWKLPPRQEFLRRKNANEPIYSPTMLGAFFVIDKDYFQLLGMYDPEFEIWGAENLELAFKVWMCGGRVEIIPCSRVGHLFRKKFPYAWPNPKGGDILRRNTDRLAEVWLDEYKRFYYRKVGDTKRNYGDVTEQKKLRERLGCKSFKWYMENVYYDHEIPEELRDETTVKTTVTNVPEAVTKQNIIVANVTNAQEVTTVKNTTVAPVNVTNAPEVTTVPANTTEDSTLKVKNINETLLQSVQQTLKNIENKFK